MLLDSPDLLFGLFGEFLLASLDLDLFASTLARLLHHLETLGLHVLYPRIGFLVVGLFLGLLEHSLLLNDLSHLVYAFNEVKVVLK